MILKKGAGLIPLCALLSSTAYARNNYGEILIQGIVSSTWEVDMYDINSHCDFDLTSSEKTLTARIGTLHVYSNDSSSFGGYLFIESENSGWLINSETESSTEVEDKKYKINLENSSLSSNELIVRDSKGYDLIAPTTIEFEPHSNINKIITGTYDVLVSIPNTAFPKSSFAYTDTITFTILDDS